MALTVEITGGGNIEQGRQVTLSAAVTDADGNLPPGTLQYAWSASRGTFIGDTDEATAVYHADFTDVNDVAVTITCNVTRPANANPTVSGPSLTALAEIGVTGILVNMFMTALGAVAPNSNSALYNASTGTLAAGSDQRLSSNIFVYQLRWDNTNNNFVLNNNEAGNIGNFFVGNDDQSVFIIFPDGTYEELPRSAFDAGTSHGNVWARWLVSDANILSLLNGLSTTDDLVVGVADTGSIGWGADAGSDTETFTAAVPLPLSVEAIDEQFIVEGTEDYVLLIDITGNPDSVDVKGHMEGFFSNWDVANAQLRIEAEEVTRLINGVTWDLDVRKGSQILTPKIKYNVILPAPILQTLPTLHLYRGVPINFDILIEHIPPLIIPNARLLGLKSELLIGNASGINVSGLIPVNANFASDAGDVIIIIPSETDEEAEMHEYPYEIEAGHPPAVGTPTFAPKGAYGEIELDDVTHALGYEWTLQSGDAAVWNFFSNDRPVIDPRTIEVTPGNLNVTITFPNIAGASRYEYMLESGNHIVDWTLFEGTLSNNMITTIIPDLQEGVAYTLRLRVASPWQGSAVSIPVYGGRFCYTLGLNTGDRDNQWLYIYHTGYANGATAAREKRLLLPTSLSHPENGGLAVNSDGDVFVIHAESGVSTHAVYVFLSDTIDTAADGSRLTQDSRHPFPTIIGNASRFDGMAAYGDKLYTYAPQAHFEWRGLQIWNTPTTDGSELTRTTTGSNTFSNVAGFGFSVTEENFWYKFSAGGDPRDVDRDLLTVGTGILLFDSDGTTGDSLGHGFEIVGNAVYNIDAVDDMLQIFRVNPAVHASRHVLDFQLRLPSGLSNPRFLSVQT